jgi:L-fuculose-phosphate aldolase
VPAPASEYELRRLIVKACRALSERGLTASHDGNISARLPSGYLLVTPSRVSKADVSEESVLYCGPDGRRIRGKGDVSSEIHLHLSAYKARPDVRAVVHAHPPVASAFTFAGAQALLAKPVLPEVVARLGSIPSVPYVTPGTPQLGAAAEPLLKTHDAVLLDQHGALTLGKDPWDAYLLMEKVEHAAVILKAARDLAGGDAGVKTLTPAQVEDLLRSYRKKGA